MVAIAKKEVEQEHIKIHITGGPECAVAGETVWAIDMGRNKARIDNIPFFIDDCCLHDIVKYKIIDGIREFVKVVEKKTVAYGATWEPTDKDDEEQTLEEWNKLREHLKSHGVSFESMIAGVIVIALPANKSHEDNMDFLVSLKESSPIDFEVYLEEESEEDEE